MKLAKKKHVPLRTCVSCGKKTTKRDLLRIVATPTDGIVVDNSGRANGRGAYVCRDGSCGSDGLQRGRVEYVLRVKLTDESWRSLADSILLSVEISN
ncbi:MAG: YlxR family protein [Chloroflexi bacterium]|nr:YlxR family protein [Chloroflexota bacterium]